MGWCRLAGLGCGLWITFPGAPHLSTLYCPLSPAGPTPCPLPLLMLPLLRGMGSTDPHPLQTTRVSLRLTFGRPHTRWPLGSPARPSDAQTLGTPCHRAAGCFASAACALWGDRGWVEGGPPARSRPVFGAQAAPSQGRIFPLEGSQGLRWGKGTDINGAAGYRAHRVCQRAVLVTSDNHVLSSPTGRLSRGSDSMDVQV